MRAQEEFSF